jgi:hypothetical protein
VGGDARGGRRDGMMGGGRRRPREDAREDARGGRIEFSVVEVVGQRLVELEGTARSVVGDGLWIGGVEARGLIEQEGSLRWSTSGRERWRPMGEALTPRNVRCALSP